MLEEVNEFVSKNVEKALYLSPEQVQAMNRFNFVAIGFYGTGKSTALEVAVDKIVEKSSEFQNAKIVFATWDTSQGLNEHIKAKFEKIKRKK